MGDKWLNSFNMLIKCFQKHNINIVVIFDGETLPAKKQEFDKRRENRKKNDEKYTRP